VTLSAREFIARFLQHVLPPGCVKVRYYGIWSNSSRRLLEQARALLDPPPPAASGTGVPRASLPQPSPLPVAPAPARCPSCRTGRLLVIQVLLPQRKSPPDDGLAVPPVLLGPTRRAVRPARVRRSVSLFRLFRFRQSSSPPHPASGHLPPAPPASLPASGNG
jgi:hypothetical protein